MEPTVWLLAIASEFYPPPNSACCTRSTERMNHDILQDLILVSDDAKSLKEHEFIDQCKLPCHGNGLLDRFVHRLRIHGCEMEFLEGSWSVAVEIGGLNRDPKKEKMLVSVQTGITAIRRALKEVDAEPAEKSIRMARGSLKRTLAGDGCAGEESRRRGESPPEMEVSEFEGRRFERHRVTGGGGYLCGEGKRGSLHMGFVW
ncbi:hypothetical protein RHSIM_Rhsim09G0019200 [Rhododendron simsii]|uniref:Uncharacterized protein n=1 Tax=Rhododendron simsii TaxID=118357 RepID=A0A834LFH0_RHOSS|nr:hypothetical protein RHSIM_Rhsim09G0019200 [Rhododendron simsii]